MLTGRTFLGSCHALKYVATVGAMPFNHRLLFKYLSTRYTIGQFFVSGFMQLFHFGHLLQRGINLMEALICSNIGSIRMNSCPFPNSLQQSQLQEYYLYPMETLIISRRIIIVQVMTYIRGEEVKKS
jgi:hypothetical protein